MAVPLFSFHVKVKRWIIHSVNDFVIFQEFLHHGSHFGFDLVFVIDHLSGESDHFRTQSFRVGISMIQKQAADVFQGTVEVGGLIINRRSGIEIGNVVEGF